MKKKKAIERQTVSRILQKTKPIYVVFFTLLILAVSTTYLFRKITGLFLQNVSSTLTTGPVDNAVEAESGNISSPATVGSDTNASGGQYVQFGAPTTNTPLSFQPVAPYYATFYYPWFKNPATDGSYSYWTDHGNTPPKTWFSHYLPDPSPGVFDPAGELYSSNDYRNFQWQLSKLAEAKQEVAILSWWGQGTKEDITANTILSSFMGRSDNPYPNLRWAFYYEKEGSGNPSVSQLVSDLGYISSHYAASPYFFKIGGKPVIFVYNADDTGSTNTNCTDATDTSAIHRWYMANQALNNQFYIVMKVYTGYATNPCQPNSWHQYAPASRSGQHGSLSYYVSPGFWLDDGSAERLPRDLVAFETAVRSMVTAQTTWKLTETWNEWGEGSSVEPGEIVMTNTSTGTDTPDAGATASYAFHNSYIDILNRNLPPLEAGTGR